MNLRFLPSREERRRATRENRNWPAELREIPREQWPPAAPPNLLRALRSRDFMVQVYREPTCLRLSANRTSFDPTTQTWREAITWDELQRLKREAGYGDRWAVEIYPPDADVVNVANMRHLFIVDAAPAYAWRGKR